LYSTSTHEEENEFSIMVEENTNTAILWYFAKTTWLQILTKNKKNVSNSSAQLGSLRITKSVTQEDFIKLEVI